MEKNWLTEYKGVKSIEHNQEFYDRCFGRESIKSDIFIFNFGKLGHPINAFAWYLVDDDLKIMYFGFNEILEAKAKDAIIKCFNIIHPSSIGYLERLKYKVLGA